MNEEVIFPKTLYHQMLEHGFAKLPFEACGLLSGKGNLVQSVWQLKNELKSANRFFVSKTLLQDTLEKIRKKEEHVLAIYHTHPSTDPIPSNLDIHNHPDNRIDMVIISYKSSPPKTKWYNILGQNYVERPFYIDLAC
ncbi:hypothetical protein GCM10010978_19300 [Compostibacillus humi]|uniref:MPN domain-containing protein n=1 Tax=Compostibacillus humi TaxID=1245525 RepID=A0A8J2XF88_9BACI|nr:M67 family metallopeptidase [Compostibacillus humi]GFZ77858.1 hypothetical protein GCM10010978_19300 [Compostibacillus humi]